MFSATGGYYFGLAFYMLHHENCDTITLKGTCPTQSAPSTVYTSHPSALPSCDSDSGGTSTGACQDTFGNAFNLTYDTQLVGSISQRIPAASLDSCLISCDGFAGCIAVDFVDGDCSLLDAVAGTEAVAYNNIKRAVAAMRLPGVATIYTAKQATTPPAITTVVSYRDRTITVGGATQYANGSTATSESATVTSTSTIIAIETSVRSTQLVLEHTTTQLSSIYTTIYITYTATAQIAFDIDLATGLKQFMPLQADTIQQLQRQPLKAYLMTPKPSNYTATLVQPTTFTQNITQVIPYTVGSSDLDYLQSSGGYSAPTITAMVTISPGHTQSPITPITTSVTATLTSTDSTLHWKRDSFHRRTRDISGEMTTKKQKRQQSLFSAALVPTPASVSGWPRCIVSEACASIATGTSTLTITTSLPPLPPDATQTVTQTIATESASCAVPVQDPAYTAFTPIWGTWSGDTVEFNPAEIPQDAIALNLPFTLCFAGFCNSMVYVYTYGQIILQEQTTPTGSNNIQIAGLVGAFGGDSSNIGIGNYGVFYRVAGIPGNRSVTFAWYLGTVGDPSALNHFTITMFESEPVAQFKYYGTFPILYHTSWALQQ
ncbi:hypothetical protein LTR42_011112 [Elasticomyces elasticus]|nr:hypothetical protein LTR42_011112 [Elasticomyces elasticus]